MIPERILHEDAPVTSSSPAALRFAPGHDEWLIDESIQETFPASDPTTPVQPGSLVSLRYAARRGTGGGIRARNIALAWIGWVRFCA